MFKEKIIRHILILVSTFIVLQATGQSGYASQFFSAFLEGKRSKWQQTLRDYEQSTTFDTKEKQLNRINYYYGTVGWLMNDDETDAAKNMLKKGEELILALLKEYENDATLFAFRGAWYGLEINLSGYKAPFLGPKSMRYINKALELDPNNIQALIEYGNALYFMPSGFGGDKNQAIASYKKAIKLIEQEELQNNNWLYLQIRARLGQMYTEMGQSGNAKVIYETLLEEYPNYKWVRDDLLPELLKKDM